MATSHIGRWHMVKKIFVQGIRWPTGDQGAEIVPVQFIHANTLQIGWQR